MRTPSSFLRTVAAVILTVALVLTLVPGILHGAGPAQDVSTRPEITEVECNFYLDPDGDGKGNRPFEADLEEYIPQETAVVGSCEFKLNAPVKATLIIESELLDWEAAVELTKEPDPAEEFRMYPGNLEIEEVEGSMRVNVAIEDGKTPRSVQLRDLTEGYRQEVQEPEEFRLLEVTVVNPDGSNDRLEQNVQSASGPYIAAEDNLSEAHGEMPEWVTDLAGEWLSDGYPQVADSIIKEAWDNLGTGGSTSIWMWLAIVGWAIIAIAIVGGGIFILLQKSGSDQGTTIGSNM